MFWENFLNLCNQNNISPNGVAKKLAISSGAVTFWKKGKVPHHSTLLKIADYFDVSVDYLLGKEEMLKNSEGSDKHSVVIRGRDGTVLKKNLTDEQVDLIRRMLEQMSDEH